MGTSSSLLIKLYWNTGGPPVHICPAVHRIPASGTSSGDYLRSFEAALVHVCLIQHLFIFAILWFSQECIFKLFIFFF